VLVWFGERYVNTKRSICANCRGEKPAQSAKDGQRDTMHITLRYTIVDLRVAAVKPT